MPYRLLSYTSDLGIEVWAMSLAELFEESARSVFSEMVNDLNSVEPRVTKEIEIEGNGVPADTLKDWLAELIYITDTEGLVFSEFKVRLEATEAGLQRLTGVARGEKISAKRHVLKRAIKSATYHNLSLKEEPWGWVATFILDI